MEHACKEHEELGGAIASCALCRRVQASSRGPWWADGFSKHKEVFDQAAPASPRTQLLANFDALDVQKGEMLAVAQQKQAKGSSSAAGAQVAGMLGCRFGNVKNKHLRALVQGDRSADAEAAALAAEEMLVLLATGKVKQSTALDTWREELAPPQSPSAPPCPALELATAASVVLDVHGIQGTAIDRSFTQARTQVGRLLLKLADTSSGNSAALLAHGSIPGILLIAGVYMSCTTSTYLHNSCQLPTPPSTPSRCTSYRCPQS